MLYGKYQVRVRGSFVVGDIAIEAHSQNDIPVNVWRKWRSEDIDMSKKDIPEIEIS